MFSFLDAVNTNHPSMRSRLLWLQRTLLPQVALLAAVMSCVSCVSPAVPLSPATGVPQRLHLSQPTIAKTDFFKDQNVALPAGDYKLVGQNEQGYYYLGSAPVGISVLLVGSNQFVTSTSTMGMRFPGGVVVQRAGFHGKTASVFATWRQKSAEYPRLVSELKEPLSLMVP